MDILLDPNVAYVLLVVGATLAILAIFTPGTGLIELGALFLLVLAGWAIYSLPVNLWALALLVVGVIPLVLAVRFSRQLIYLAVAELAFVIGSSFLFRLEGTWLPAVNPLLALVVSALAAGYLWLAAVKVLEAERARPQHDPSTLIGQVGEARTPIQESGSVYVAGEMWSARSDGPIPAGQRVRVLGRAGLVLWVEAA